MKTIPIIFAFLYTVQVIPSLIQSDNAFIIAYGGAPFVFAVFLYPIIAYIILSFTSAYLSQKKNQHKVLVLILVGISLASIIEARLSVSFVRSILKQQMTRHVEVFNIKDEIRYSEKDTLMGIRVTFSANVPVTGKYSIEPYLDSNDFFQYGPPQSDSLPDSVPDSYFKMFKRGVTYTITQDFLPLFYGDSMFPSEIDFPSKYQWNTKPPPEYKRCFDKPFLLGGESRGLPREIPRQFNIQVWVDGGSGKTELKSEQKTQRSYSIKEFYEAAKQDGVKECAEG